MDIYIYIQDKPNALYRFSEDATENVRLSRGDIPPQPQIKISMEDFEVSSSSSIGYHS